jgi:disulfide bond formation protein DsbB
MTSTVARVMSPRPSTSTQEAYRLGAAVLVVATSVIIAALGFEYIGGYLPCPLCLQQRYAYYAGIPVTFLALVMVQAGKARVAALLLFAVALAFLANTGLGAYHAGAEWGYWPGPESCGTVQAIGGKTGGLLGKLDAAKVIKCNEAQWRLAGLSFAGWNVVVSALMFVTALKAAFAASPQD